MKYKIYRQKICKATITVYFVQNCISTGIHVHTDTETLEVGLRDHLKVWFYNPDMKIMKAWTKVMTVAGEKGVNGGRIDTNR